jgi:hypothetical protein
MITSEYCAIKFLKLGRGLVAKSIGDVVTILWSSKLKIVGLGDQASTLN